MTSVDAVSNEVGPDRVAKQAALAAPKGVPEYLPPGSAAFEHVRDTLVAAADRAGYALVELPVFEDTALYARGRRRVDRRRQQGDVHLRRPWRALGDPAARRAPRASSGR